MIPAPLSLTAGALFAREYRIVRLLAQGGMGAVYVAEQQSTGKERALKVMHADLLRDPSSRARFEQEARLAARIDSDHVVEVVGAGVDEETGAPWLAMELLKGETLAEALERRSAMPLPVAAELLRQLGRALVAAHAAGVVHRDLKPENLFLANTRRANEPFVLKVLDFGISKVLASARTAATTTSGAGSPLWMAPEQANAGPVRPATDVWAFGLIAFTCLTGVTYWRSPRREGGTVQSLLVEILIDPLEPASARAREVHQSERLPLGFDPWFARCVARAFELRFRDALEAYGALEPLLATPAYDSSLAATLWSSPPTPSQSDALASTMAQPNTPTPYGALAPVDPRPSLGPATPSHPSLIPSTRHAGAFATATPGYALAPPSAVPYASSSQPGSAPFGAFVPSSAGAHSLAPTAPRTGLRWYIAVPLSLSLTLLGLVVVRHVKDLLDTRPEHAARPALSAAPSASARFTAAQLAISTQPPAPLASDIPPATRAAASAAPPAPLAAEAPPAASAPVAVPTARTQRAIAAPGARAGARALARDATVQPSSGFVRNAPPNTATAAASPSAPLGTPIAGPSRGPMRDTTPEEQRAILRIVAPLIEGCWQEAQSRMTPPIAPQPLALNLHTDGDGRVSLALAQGPADTRLTDCIEARVSSRSYRSIGVGFRLFSRMTLTPD